MTTISFASTHLFGVMEPCFSLCTNQLMKVAVAMTLAEPLLRDMFLTNEPIHNNTSKEKMALQNIYVMKRDIQVT